ncbi:hypothetical protein ACVWYN_003741 [Pedobacter sp. UYP24]
MLSFFYQVAIMALAGIIIVGFAYYLVKDNLYQYLKFKTSGGSNMDADRLFNLRIQAYERMIVFVERINPANILIRLHQPEISITTMQSIVINEINAEYQHNIAQQLYVSAPTWNVVRKLKEDTQAMIVNAATGLPQDATGLDLSRKVLQHLAGVGQNPYDLTLDLIKSDIHKKF